jgi:hypothetical protein
MLKVMIRRNKCLEAGHSSSTARPEERTEVGVRVCSESKERRARQRAGYRNPSACAMLALMTPPNQRDHSPECKYTVS